MSLKRVHAERGNNNWIRLCASLPHREAACNGKRIKLNLKIPLPDSDLFLTQRHF